MCSYPSCPLRSCVLRPRSVGGTNWYYFNRGHWDSCRRIWTRCESLWKSAIMLQTELQLHEIGAQHSVLSNVRYTETPQSCLKRTLRPFGSLYTGMLFSRKSQASFTISSGWLKETIDFRGDKQAERCHCVWNFTALGTALVNGTTVPYRLYWTGGWGLSVICHNYGALLSYRGVAAEGPFLCNDKSYRNLYYSFMCTIFRTQDLRNDNIGDNKRITFNYKLVALEASCSGFVTELKSDKQF